MENIKKIETKMKTDYKLIAPILFLVILLISLFVFLYFNKYNRYHEEVTLKGYQYLTKEKDEFEIEISQSRKKEIIGYKIKGNEDLQQIAEKIKFQEDVLMPEDITREQFIKELKSQIEWELDMVAPSVSKDILHQEYLKLLKIL